MKKILSTVITAVCGVILIAAVVVIALYFCNYRFYAVKSGSMEPTIPVGALILVNENDTDLEEGDIAMYQTEYGTMVTHRVIKVYPDGYQFRGDANNTEDIEEISQDQVVGTYVFYIPEVGEWYLNFSALFNQG